MRRVLLAGLRVNSFQARGAGGNQAESKITAGILQLAITFGLTLLFAALSHRHIDEIQPRLAHQAHGQAADDALVIRVWRKEERFRSVWRYVRSCRRLDSAQRQRFALFEKVGVFGNELVIGVHKISGKLAAATAWPWR